MFEIVVAQLFKMQDGKFCIWELESYLRWRLAGHMF